MTDRERVQAIRAADAAARESSQREFSRPVVVEAGAGTGKTSLLVARIVVWALGPGWERARGRLAAGEAAPSRSEPTADRVASDVLSRVAAITFTDAAAAEMATRAGAALAAVEAGRLPLGVFEWALPAAADRRERARALLGALDQLLVRTIHAYCRRLLAQFPLDARIHPTFEVDADGLAQAEVVREVVEEAVRAGYGESGDPDLIALAVDGVGPAQLEAALTQLVAKGVRASAFAATPFSAERIAAFAAELDEAVAAFQALEGGRLAQVTRSPTTQTVLDAVAATASWLARETPGSAAELDAWVSELQDRWDDGSGARPKRLKQWARGRFNVGERNAIGDDADALAERAAALAALVDHARSLAPAQLERARRALGPLLERAQTALRVRGRVTFDALLREARDLLRDHPDVRGRVRAELDQLLVDEFQDTDPLQCEVIRWIALEGPERERPGLFLVGDPKQSIYGWRSADLRAYQGFVDEILGPGGEPERLAVNHRSLPGVLAEVDRVIDPVMRREDGLQPAFQRLVASPERESEPAAGLCVEHWVSWDWDAAEQQPRCAVTASRAAQLEAEALARDVCARHARGELAWGEVGVLLRSTGDLEVYLQALRAAGVPYAVERDRGYFRRREVIEASALARCVLDRNDHVALLAWLRSAAVGVPDAALLPLWSRDFPRLVTSLQGPDAQILARLDAAIAGAVADIPEDVPGLDRVRGWDACLRQSLAAIARLRASFDGDPADVFVEKLRTTSLIEVTEAARFLGPFRVANLDRFFRELLADLESAGDRATLLRRLRTGVTDDREAEEARPSEAVEDAVRVMTIHKAKGLAFRHTYVVQLHKQSGGRSRGRDEVAIDTVGGACEYRLFGAPTLGFHAVARQAERVASAERVRSLYVAMTRARDRLVLLGRWPERPEAVPPESAACHLDLLVSRRPGPPDLVGQMRRLGATGGAAFDRDSATWVFPALVDATPAAHPAPAARGAFPAAAELRADASALRARRAEARARAQRPWNAAASADAHTEAREERAETGFGDAVESSRPARGGAGGPGREAALAAGTAVHRILEDFDLGADPAVELERQQSRLEALVAALAGESARAPAFERASEVLAKLRRGSLLRRLHALADHVVARELPLLLPPSEPARGPVGFLAGSIDLCYRDPETGEIVVVDYKTDPVSGGDDVAELVERYTPQGRHYQRALREALQLESDPRFELWFLDADRVEVVA